MYQTGHQLLKKKKEKEEEEEEEEEDYLSCGYYFAVSVIKVDLLDVPGSRRRGPTSGLLWDEAHPPAPLPSIVLPWSLDVGPRGHL